MNTLSSLVQHGGLPMYINFGVSVVVIAVIAERLIALFMQYRINMESFLRAILNLIKNGQIDRALKYCESTKLAIAKVCRAGLLKANRGSMEISTAIDEELMRVMPGLEKRIATLWSLANIATLIGLIGTIFGLIRAFSGLASVSPEQKTAFLARGISEALNNTAVGLTIAVTCMIGHVILSNISKKLVGDLETSAVSLENYLVQQYQAEKK
jgi:biopolymer transport protein ExbB/TolQ